MSLKRRVDRRQVIWYLWKLMKGRYNTEDGNESDLEGNGRFRFGDCAY